MEPDSPLDEILQKIGSWGKFQFYYYACLGFVVAYSVFSMSYIFTSRDIRYRPQWLQKFVPYKDGFPSRCQQYELLESLNSTCAFQKVNKNVSNICERFVYEREETTIVHDFNIHCAENLWKLTIVGTINVVGELVCLSYAGFISDKFGRKNLMITSVLLSMCAGILRSFSTNYFMYLVLEFLDTALSGGMYGAAFILAMELMAPMERNKGNTVISCVYALGQIILGIAAMLSPSWRIMLRMLYISGLISISFYWTVPESIRWLISVRRNEDAKRILANIAKINRKELPSELLDANLTFEDNETAKNIYTETFRDAIKSRVLFCRTIHCSYTWICCTFVYYGLTIQSVAISDNIYLSFIFTVAIEIPAYVIYYFVNERIGRRKIMFITLLLAGIFCIAAGLTPAEDYFWARLITFLAGKCCMTIAYTVLYVYTTEMFPTCSRHTMFSICSMFGRFGSMIAPQVPLLARIAKTLPLLLFGVLSVSSGALALLFPETLNTKLPDTIKQAVIIGRETSRPLMCLNDENNLPLR